jgi:hypothetical protein
MEFSAAESCRASPFWVRRGYKNTIPNVFGASHAKDCLLLQRFALEAALEFNAESYFLARFRELLRREGDCGILTRERRGRRKPTL